MTTREFTKQLVQELEAIGAGEFTRGRNPEGAGRILKSKGQHYLARRMETIVQYKRSYDEYRYGQVSEFECTTNGETWYAYSNDTRGAARRIERAIRY